MLLLPPLPTGGSLEGGAEDAADDREVISRDCGGAAEGQASGVTSEAAVGAGVPADGTAIPRILERIRERRSVFTLAAISLSVSPILIVVGGSARNSIFDSVLGQAMNRSLEEGAPMNPHDEMMSKLKRSNFNASMNCRKMMMIASRKTNNEEALVVRFHPPELTSQKENL